jgi:hypothetical protein
MAAQQKQNHSNLDSKDDGKDDVDEDVADDRSDADFVNGNRFAPLFPCQTDDILRSVFSKSW